MKLSAPKVYTFWIAVLVAIFGLIAYLNLIPALAAYAFWLVLLAFVILLLGTLIKDF